MSLHVKQSGAIKEATSVSIKQSSVWQSVTSLWTKYLGTWKLVFPYYAIKITGTSLGPPETNNYLYEIINSSDTVIVASGDKLVFDLWVDAFDTYASVDCHISGVTGTVLREKNIEDQNGLRSHPATAIGAYAFNQWYHREFSLDSIIGATMYQWILAFENDPVGQHTVYAKDIKVVDSSGNVKLQVFHDWFDDFPDTAYATNFSLDSKSLVVKGN